MTTSRRRCIRCRRRSTRRSPGSSSPRGAWRSTRSPRSSRSTWPAGIRELSGTSHNVAPQMAAPDAAIQRPRSLALNHSRHSPCALAWRRLCLAISGTTSSEAPLAPSMRAMVMAAGLGTRLRPLTYEGPKPVVPVVNRPVMEHIPELLPRHGFTEVISNLHWFPDTIRDRIGDGSALGIELTYRFEEELLGTAGGFRNVAEFFGDEPFLVMAGDALTDIDLSALRQAHERNGGIATLAVKRV